MGELSLLDHSAEKAERKKLLLIVNPIAGRVTVGSYILDMTDLFIKSGYTVTLYVTQAGDDTERVILEEGRVFDTIVCCGGDGTLSIAAGAILKLDTDCPPCLGYIPCGTVNDFASTRKIPKNPLEAAALIAQGNTCQTDLGYFMERPFVYVAAFGLFTEASYQTPRTLKNSLGKLAYILEGAKSLAHIRSYRIHFTYGDQEIEDEFVYGMMTNSRTIGGFSLPINEDAELDDGLMEVTLVRMPKTPADRQALLGALLAQKADEKYVYHFQTDRISFSSDTPFPWTVDGEFGGEPGCGTICLKHGVLKMYC